MPFRYVPVLRTKAGEATALSNLPAQSKARLLPIINLTAQPAARFVAQLSAGWSQHPLALDGLYSEGITGSSNAFKAMFKDLGKAKILVIPSVECNAVASYVATVKSLVGNYAPGLVVQATIAQLSGAEAWVTAQGWQPKETDLVVNVGHIGAYGDMATFSAFVTQALATGIKSPPQWRTVTLASAAAPKDYSALALGKTVVKRLDWLLWNHVHGSLPFPLDYGDYGISHPDLTEAPGVAMTRASVSVRYTVDDDWIIIKGNATTGAHAKPMAQQYLAHAKALVKEPQFGGVANCWGDQRIQHIAALTAGSSGIGSRATWVSIGASRHISLVADRLP
jgi:hypothetical protein